MRYNNNMKFNFKAKSKEGEIVNSVFEAKDRVEALVELKKAYETILFIEENKNRSLKINISFFKRVKAKEKIMFTKNIASMLEAGIAISRALQILEKQTDNKYFKSIITDIGSSISKGDTFSAGLAKYKNIFPPLFVSIVRAGEESGGLVQALREVGSNLEKSYNLNKKIKGAMMYPSVILAAIVVIGILMMIFVVPTLTKTFKDLGTELPATTKFVIATSDFMASSPILLLVFIIILVGGIYALLKVKKVKRGLDWLIPRLPAIGTIVKETYTARTARTLSSLILAGIDITRAIEITKDVVENTCYKDVLEKAKTVVQKGGTLSSIFKENTKLYPIMLGEMVEVGEETGKLSTMLGDIATFYEAEVDSKTKNLSTIIEPVLMIFIGVAVGFFAVSMLSPMYSLMDSIG
jgi:type IV pilus assembly protein PilC